MNTTLGIKTTTGDKIFHHVNYVRMADGFMYITYQQDGQDKKAIFEMEYITHFVMG